MILDGWGRAGRRGAGQGTCGTALDDPDLACN